MQGMTGSSGVRASEGAGRGTLGARGASERSSGTFGGAHRGVVYAALVAAASVVSAISGCSSSDSNGPATALATDAGADGSASSNDDAASSGEACAASLEGACGDCMKASCCDALAACEQDPDCAACVAGKDGDACERTAETHERVDHYLVCKGGACNAACIGESENSCAGLLKDLVTDACATCMEESCCEQVANCKASAVCWDGCFTNHDESKCHGDPDGHAVYHAMGECGSKHCAKVCQ